MNHKQLFFTTGFCLLLLAVFLSIAGASGQANTPLRIHYTTDSDLARGTTAIFDYTVEFIDKYRGYIAPETQITLDYIKITCEVGDEHHGNKYTFDTLETRSWKVEMDANGSASGTLELGVPEDTSITVNIIAINGKEFTFASIGFDRKSNIPGRQEYIKRTPDSTVYDPYREPSFDELTPQQLQTEYEVAIDLRDTSKMAEATRILGKIPAGKELVKYPNAFRIKASLSNLIELINADIKFVFITAPSWVRPAQLVKDSTEIQTIEDVDSQSVTPPPSTPSSYSHLSPQSPGGVSIDSVSGLNARGEIRVDTIVTFYLHLNNYTDFNIYGLTHGFKVFSLDDADWFGTEPNLVDETLCTALV
ncbi:MAG: hypothetical protein R3F48_08785 [Candidatus Zixiibacteriota bacterium]